MKHIITDLKNFDWEHIIKMHTEINSSPNHASNNRFPEIASNRRKFGKRNVSCHTRETVN
jgi:hypothetical protein